MSEKTWKRVQRETARYLGAVHTHNTGQADPDVVGERLVVEVKHRRDVPAWLTGALAQARRYAAVDQLGVALIHPHGCAIAESLVVLRLEDFKALYQAGLEK